MALESDGYELQPVPVSQRCVYYNIFVCFPNEFHINEAGSQILYFSMLGMIFCCDY